MGCGLYMNGEKGLAVRAYGYGTSTVPVAGIVESHTGQAKVKVFDTGIEDFAPIETTLIPDLLVLHP